MRRSINPQELCRHEQRGDRCKPVHLADELADLATHVGRRPGHKREPCNGACIGFNKRLNSLPVHFHDFFALAVQGRQERRDELELDNAPADEQQLAQRVLVACLARMHDFVAVEHDTPGSILGAQRIFDELACQRREHRLSCFLHIYNYYF